MEDLETRCGRELDAILGVYESLGFPREVVTQWSLPASDVADLWRIASATGARRVLEVGSFVGTSAFLMARALPEATVHSVDPNLPLEVEFEAMGSAERSADLGRRTLDIARESAQRLGLAERVRFHEGGFAVGATFALNDIAIPVIGPDLCAREGPFDLAFVDGLHFEDAVVADLGLALRALAPGGVVAMHDAIGYWGSHVRRAVHRVLERDPGLCFTHAPYADLYRGIGTLAQKGRATPPLGERAEACHRDSRALAEHLARLIRSTFPGARFAGHDELAASIATNCGGAREAAAPLVAIALDAVDPIEPSAQAGALARTLDGADAAVLGFSPPGEDRAAGAWARPLASRVAELDALGFDAHDLIYPFLEPYTHPYGGPTALERRTSFAMDAIVAVKRSGALARAIAGAPLSPAVARGLSDMRLQLLYGTRSFANMRAARETMQSAYDGLRTQHDALEAEHRRQAEIVAHWSAWRVHLGRHHFWRRPRVVQ